VADKSQTPRQVLALEIIEAGRKTLAKTHHPDHGGTHEQFLALTAAMEWLRGLVNGTPPCPPTIIVVRPSTMTRAEREAFLYDDDTVNFPDRGGEL
jgi:hypothetical protein